MYDLPESTIKQIKDDALKLTQNMVASEAYEVYRSALTEKNKAPTKPVLKANHTSSEAIEYANKLTNYEAFSCVHEATLEAHRVKKSTLREAYLDKVIEEDGSEFITNEMNRKILDYVIEEKDTDDLPTILDMFVDIISFVDKSFDTRYQQPD